MSAQDNLSPVQFAAQHAENADNPSWIGSSKPLDHVGPTPSHYTRWMHIDEYNEAKKKGHYKYNMNVSPGGEGSDDYKDTGMVQVKFPHMSGVFKEKENYTGSGRAAWATTNIPFHLGDVMYHPGEK